MRAESLATMPAKKKPVPIERDAGPVQINLRVSPEMLAALDEWVDALNAQRSWPKLTRTDVLRTLLERGLKERPAL